MYKIILAYDKQDEETGEFFHNCAKDLKNITQNLPCEIIKVPSERLSNTAFIDVKISVFDEQPFIFIAYSHGSKKAFLGANGAYVKAGYTTQFSNSLCYSFTCESASQLGPDLIQNGCRSFWGYNEEVNVYSTYQQVFVECANYGFKQLLNGDTMQEAFDKMIDFHNQQIDFIADKNYFVASILMENRDALTLLGDKGLVLENFTITIL